jgi:ribosomal protein S18 acetylase RimI-like enzyme
MWDHLLSLEDVVTHVVEVDKVVVGFMSARQVQAPVAALEMSPLYVHPDRFGRGFGARLHEVFESERQPDRVGLLEVWQGNHRAIEFYQRHGWVATPATRPGPHDTPFITYRLETR